MSITQEFPPPSQQKKNNTLLSQTMQSALCLLCDNRQEKGERMLNFRAVRKTQRRFR
jgi:hypothetical protein